MGSIQKSSPAVKLISGIIFKEEKYFYKAKKSLCRAFGDIDFESAELGFNHTQYYRQEFGEPLKRKFLSFKRLIHPPALPKIKIRTNKIEQRLSAAGRRLANIDPGYLDLAKLVLASTKDYAHRVYLDRGIYAEITLNFRENSFRPLVYTYPDYCSQEYLEVFNNIRQIYREQTK